MKHLTSIGVVGVVVLLEACAVPADDGAFTSSWERSPDRRWVGADFWANRLQDWQVTDGRLASTVALPLRTVHLLTRTLGENQGALDLAVTVVPLDPASDAVPSSAGLLIGAGRGLDYRAAALIHHARGPVAGLYAGVDTDGRVFVRDLETEGDAILVTSEARGPIDSASLAFTARPQGNAYTITLEAALWNAARDTIRVTSEEFPAERLIGNVGLVADARGGSDTRFAFSAFRAEGSKLERHDDRALGPVIGTQHTLSRGTLTLTAQFMPLGASDGHEATLQRREGGSWTTVGTATIVDPGYTATFRVPDWPDTVDIPFRVTYPLTHADGTTQGTFASGTVRRDPRDVAEIVVAAFTGNANAAEGVDRPWFAWDEALWFPQADVVTHARAHAPHLLFFSGDQVYEGASPTRADFAQPYEDYLYKWYLWYWSFRDLTAEIPAVTIPDDHDVFHGNVWGAGGRATPPGLAGADAQDAGGYKLPPAWVNMVQRTQTSHLPPPYDPIPVDQGIGVYYTDLVYGGVSFAVIEDRKWKSAPKPLLPSANVWNGWALNPAFDAAREADVPGATLLGDRQLAFLEHWAGDWSGGAWMKVLLSQTIFANVATLPDTAHTGSVIPSLPILDPGTYAEDERPVADMDSNGWPQTGRNRAVRAIRKGYAVHLAGDQHLGSTVQYGVDAWRDAGFALCVPSVANFWPRRWYPPASGGNHDPAMPRYTGDYRDGFGNLITVYAVSNPEQTGRDPVRLHNRAPGYGIARFDRATRRIRLEAWPRWSDPAAGGTPYPGWPIEFTQTDNDGRVPMGLLPTFVITTFREPVVQVIAEATGEVVSTIRIAGTTVTPRVFAPGAYTVRIGDPDAERWEVYTGLVAGSGDTIPVRFSGGVNH
ncbi:MAG: alkaline phosphatase D family protein [Gemmatimonadota bacterium]|nr:alkaline phosphatase D family protein [Gemmatimonadota bacterium]